MVTLIYLICLLSDLGYNSIHRLRIFDLLFTKMLQSIYYLIMKDLKVELRQQYAIAGILLFVFTMVYIIYRCFQDVGDKTWNVLFWIILLFVALNTVLKSFIQEDKDRAMYYYSLFDPIAVIIAKIIYNFILLLFVGALIILLMSFLMTMPVKDLPLFIYDVILTCLGLSVVYSFTSAISSLNKGSATLLAVLAIPLSLPIILLSVKISANAIGFIDDSSIVTDLLYIGAIDILFMGMAILLFPTLWKS